MTKDEALKLALEALEQIDKAMPFPVAKLAQKSIREALAQPEQNQFNPDWDAMAVMVEEQQRMAKRIEELEAHRKPLSSVELVKIELSLRKYHDYDRYDLSLHDFARAIEAAHGIKE